VGVPSGELTLAIDGEVMRGVAAGEEARGELMVAILVGAAFLAAPVLE
jgi:hypothetical protein